MEEEQVHDRERFARENHSEIERRRRNKMTAYITELSDMVPTCSTLTRKPDKLTILRMAVAHMKNLRGTGNQTNDGSYKPSFLTDQELKHLILEAADGFLFVVACDSGRFHFVSDSVSPVLNHSQNDFYSSTIYKLLHPDDIEKVREQLSTQDSNSGRILDLKTGTVKKEGHQSSVRMSTSIRRGFICRMRMGNYQPDHNILNRFRNRNTVGPQIDNHSYAVVHCTGYIKSWPPTQNMSNSMDRGMEDEQHRVDNYCLIAIARLQVTSAADSNDLLGSNSNSEFISRHSLDGKFTFVDQRVINILGYQPQELLDKVFFDFLNAESQARVRETFENVLKLKGHYVTCYYKIKAKNDIFVELKTTCYAFINPYTNEVEYIVCTNQLNNQALDQQVDHQLHQQNQLNQLNQQLNQTGHLHTDSMMRLHAQNQTQQQQYHQHHNQLSNTGQASNNGLTINDQQQKSDAQNLDAYNAYNNRSVQQQHLNNQAIAQDRCVQQQLQSNAMYPPTYDPQQMHYAQQTSSTNQAQLNQMDQKQNVDYTQAYQMSSPSSRSPTTYTQLNSTHQAATGAWAANQWAASANQMDTNTNGQQTVAQPNDMNVMQLQMLQQHEQHHAAYEHDLNMFNSFPE